MVQQIEITAEEDLLLGRDLLKKAGLQGRLRVIVEPGGIHILPEHPSDPAEILDRLAGCLGQEPAGEYDFGLKIGGWHEAR